jgi:hypothetical protein
MSWRNRGVVRVLPDKTAAAVLIVFVCICIVSQMLGAPVTLLGLLMSDAPVESLSEDFSIPPITPEPGRPHRSGFYAEIQPSRYLPVFSTAVFHPPLG